MATYKLPKNWNAFNAWFTSFHKAFNMNAKKYGFSPNDIKAVNQFYKNWQNCFASYNTYIVFNKAMGQFYTNEFTGFQGFAQNFMGMISTNKAFNGNWNTFFGTTTTTKSVAKKSTAKKATAKKTTATKPMVKKITAKKPTVKKSISATTKKTTRTNPRAKTTTIKAVKPMVKKAVSKVTKRVTAARKAKPIAKKSTRSVSKTITNKPIAKKMVAKKAIAKKTVAKKPIVKSVKSKINRTSVRSTSTKPTAIKAKVSRLSARKVTKKSTSTNGTYGNNAPFVWFTSGKGGVNVYVGSTKNGNFNLPTGYKSAYVEFKSGSGRWTKLTQGANFPFVHNYNGKGQIQYRACWINTSGKKGSWSKPASFTQNTVKAAA